MSNCSVDVHATFAYKQKGVLSSNESACWSVEKALSPF